MTNDRLRGLLGLARRARKLALGHDAAVEAVRTGRAALCLLAADASERLYAEFLRETRKFARAEIPLLQTDYTMEELGQSVGQRKTAVLTVNDHGFADRITELIGRE